MLAPILFFILAAVAIVGALGMLLSRNPVHSALSLILNLFCVAGLYLTLNAEFIGVVQVIVYAGAIMVLFLFVIMLLNLEAMPRLQDFDARVALGLAGGTVLLALLTYVLARSLDSLPEASIGPEEAASGSARAIAKDLFTTYALPFEIIGLLLLVATIGAVMIAKKRFV